LTSTAKRTVDVRTAPKVKTVLTQERIQVKSEPQREQMARRPTRMVARVVQKETW
jgi:hypothetical protein